MTSCSFSNMASFRLEADLHYIDDDYQVVLSPDGCYEAFSDSRYYTDGDLEDGEYYFKTENLSEFEDLDYDEDYSDDVGVWVIATFQNSTYTTRCRDYNLYDYTTQHPAEVSHWKCVDDEDEDWAYDATISTTCGCSTPAPTPAPATPELQATPGPTADGLTPAPRTPEVAPTPPPVSTASDEGASAGEVAGGVVAGVVVVVAVVLAALFKTGRLKINRTGKQQKLSHDNVAGGSGSTGNARPAASEAPVPHQYPVAYQYPEAIR